MSFQIVFRFVIVAVVLLLAVWADSPAETVADDRSEVVETVGALFNALETNNDAQFASLLTRDFYLFDGGIRFSGQGILSLLKAGRAAGNSYKWSVSEPDVHIIGNTAWVTYINMGSITDSSGTRDQEWLESAFLEKQEAVWKIAFMQSTRVPKPRCQQKLPLGKKRGSPSPRECSA